MPLLQSTSLLQVESDNLTITMNETIPLLMVAGAVSTVLILAFIAFAAISILRPNSD